NRVIPAKTFHCKSQNGITYEVKSEHVPIKFLAAIHPSKPRIQPKVQNRIVNLRRVHWDCLPTHWVCFMPRRKANRPRRATNLPKAAAKQQTSDSTEAAPKGDARRHHISGFPQRHVLQPGDKYEC